MLQAIQFSSHAMHLHVSNLSDFKLLKYGAFVANEKVFDAAELTKDVIKTCSFESSHFGIEISMKASRIDSLVEMITDAERVTQVL